MLQIKVRRFAWCHSLPTYATEGSAGMDLYARSSEVLDIAPGTSRLIGCGFAIEIPQGYEGQVRSRSGLAKNHSVVVLNSPGTIDRDFRGEVGVLLFNHGNTTFTVTPGMRIAQLVICPIQTVELVQVDRLEETERGAKGFGSTG